MRKFQPPYKQIDKRIRRAVRILYDGGVETTQSCEGGKEHAFPEPTVCFCGTNAAGYKALSVAIDNGLPIRELRRVYQFEGGELRGPEWQMTFWRTT